MFPTGEQGFLQNIPVFLWKKAESPENCCHISNDSLFIDKKVKFGLEKNAPMCYTCCV